MFRTSGIHVFAQAPVLLELRQTLTLMQPELGLVQPTLILTGTFLIAALTRRLHLPGRSEGGTVVFCAALALVPILILYGVSATTLTHIFVTRYRLVAIPGLRYAGPWLSAGLTPALYDACFASRLSRL